MLLVILLVDFEDSVIALSCKILCVQDVELSESVEIVCWCFLVHVLVNPHIVGKLPFFSFYLIDGFVLTLRLIFD